jgi:hypothetical protein
MGCCDGKMEKHATGRWSPGVTCQGQCCIFWCSPFHLPLQLQAQSTLSISHRHLTFKAALLVLYYELWVFPPGFQTSPLDSSLLPLFWPLSGFPGRSFPHFLLFIPYMVVYFICTVLSFQSQNQESAFEIGCLSPHEI